MNKKLILMAISAMMFYSVSYAQKVIKGGVYVVIDCSSMDPRFYTSTPKPYATSATNTSAIISATDIASPQSNAKVYKKFKVSDSNESNDDNGSNWAQAINKTCIEGDWWGGGLDKREPGWRLPTLRELMLIYILRTKMWTKPSTSQYVYWSSTEYGPDGPDFAWFVDFSTGHIGYEKKVNKNQVRCVYDIK